MFRLHRHKSSAKSGERIDFTFSNIQALQVPKGWDKLYVSLLSSETGKTISKSGKATVRNGTCKWTETLSETIWISKDEASKDLQQYFFKLVVVMGSARSSILGEATINMAGYMSSRASAPVSLPLKKCNHGTILQVEIQCLTPRINGRDEKMNPTNSYVEDANSDYDDVDNRSEVSDCTFTKSVGSSSSNHLDDTFHPGDQGSRCMHLHTKVPAPSHRGALHPSHRGAPQSTSLCELSLLHLSSLVRTTGEITATNQITSERDSFRRRRARRCKALQNRLGLLHLSFSLDILHWLHHLCLARLLYPKASPCALVPLRILQVPLRNPPGTPALTLRTSVQWLLPLSILLANTTGPPVCPAEQD
ncbi:hypothetical protein Acr_24g0007930 [Actinidia rufa]|uniref:C2 NT-type domain-containing protein n=1 Tax=Actinidia rufa TaxID=165716 RepID=A0A7J0GUY2_9ERIC|nr:hypothetical protein Acr_24g0007930 [Actinidia rufa]